MELIEAVEGEDKNDNAHNVIEKGDMEEETTRRPTNQLRYVLGILNMTTD